MHSLSIDNISIHTLRSDKTNPCLNVKKTTHNLFLNTENYTQSFLKIVSMKCFRPIISEVFEVWAKNNPSLVTRNMMNCMP